VETTASARPGPRTRPRCRNARAARSRCARPASARSAGGRWHARRLVSTAVVAPRPTASRWRAASGCWLVPAEARTWFRPGPCAALRQHPAVHRAGSSDDDRGTAAREHATPRSRLPRVVQRVEPTGSWSFVRGVRMRNGIRSRPGCRARQSGCRLRTGSCRRRGSGRPGRSGLPRRPAASPHPPRCRHRSRAAPCWSPPRTR
jgi:hypothetical protein